MSEEIEAAGTGRVRRAIVAAAASLIAERGQDAATTRAVAAAAGVQPPTIYRLFGDKRGLMEAVVEHGLETYVAAKAARTPDPDSVQELRRGWDMHVAFGLENPELFRLMTANPQPAGSPTRATGKRVLQHRIRRIATDGRLRVSEARALALLQAGGTGTVLTLLDQPPDERDLELSAAAREATICAITGDPQVAPSDGPAGAAAALRANLDDTHVLSAGERHLLIELLDRIANGDSDAATLASGSR